MTPCQLGNHNINKSLPDINKNKFSALGNFELIMEDNSWESMWAAGVPRGAKFDGNGASPALAAFLDTRPTPPAGATALVPGCGRAYDAVALAAKGYAVRAWDISRTAVGEARRLVAEAAPEVAARVTAEHRDFFDAAQDQGGQTFDLIWDCTFLCALPPGLRAAWAARHAALLSKDGGDWWTGYLQTDPAKKKGQFPGNFVAPATGAALFAQGEALAEAGDFATGEPKTSFLRFRFILNTPNILPRQARDEHKSKLQHKRILSYSGGDPRCGARAGARE